jgi:hypothetical protein
MTRGASTISASAAQRMRTAIRGSLAGQHADGWSFVRLPHVALEPLDVERELSEIGGLEPVDLQLDGHEALQAAVEEDEVDREILVADLHRILRANEAEVAKNSRAAAGLA